MVRKLNDESVKWQLSKEKTNINSRWETERPNDTAYWIINVLSIHALMIVIKELRDNTIKQG